MRRLRVFVVDDSVVARHLLSRTLSSDPAVEVVGTAPNGRLALAKIARFNPDVVTLDVEMPEMDGLQTLAALRKTRACLPVIMFSVFTQPGAAATLSALAFKGVDCVAKPPAGASAEDAVKVIREELLPRIKRSCPASVEAPSEDAPAAPKAPAAPPFSPPLAAPRSSQRVDIVVIGVSTGGPDALAQLLPRFPADFPVPILIVQHMPPAFTKRLAERLAARSRIGVAEAGAGQVLEPGHAWLAPGGCHMRVERVEGIARIRISQDPPENSCRPSVDVLFRSAAEIFGSHVLAVVMTGMGQDGVRGCERIYKAGGQVLAQDEASSVVWGIAKAISHAGMVDQVLPLSALGPEILRRVAGRRLPARLL